MPMRREYSAVDLFNSLIKPAIIFFIVIKLLPFIVGRIDEINKINKIGEKEIGREGSSGAEVDVTGWRAMGSSCNSLSLVFPQF